MMQSAHLAIDIGASGGTAYLGRVGVECLEIEESYRFPNRPVKRADGRYVWNVPRLTHQLIEGIRRADAMADGLDSIGIDTWGVDFGLVADGDLLQNPYSYRDPVVYGTHAGITKQVDRKAIFDATGISHWDARTSLAAYYYLTEQQPDLLDEAEALLMMPQVFAQQLGAHPCVDPTIASTTQLFDPRTECWATELLAALDLPTDVLPSPETPGSILGSLDTDVTGLESNPALVLPASHDTASAVAALPFRDANRVFLATGTVFILGVVREEPLLSEAAFEVGISNELGVNDTVRILKNMNNGFFLFEQCRSVWANQDEPVDYGRLITAAQSAEPFQSLIDPDAALFETVGDMPAKIQQYCAATDQPVPATNGAITRCIFESLATKAALLLDEIIKLVGMRSDRLHVCGGGVRNELFCQMLADATDMEVYAGPAEAAVVGNLLVQARTAGTIECIAAGRRLVEMELGLDRYAPVPTAGWTSAHRRMERLCASGTASNESSG